MTGFPKLKCRLSAAESEAEGGLSDAFLEESLRDSSLIKMPPFGGRKRGRFMTAKQFARRMEESQAKFYRLAYCYVKNEHDALEIVSEAAYRGFIHLGRLEKPEFFDTWMSRIVINCACDLLKKQNRFDFHEPDDSLPAKEEELSVDDRLDLYQALDALSPDEKSLIILKYFEDRSFREISSILKLPESTVKTRLYRVIGKLRTAMV